MAGAKGKTKKKPPAKPAKAARPARPAPQRPAAKPAAPPPRAAAAKPAAPVARPRVAPAPPAPPVPTPTPAFSAAAAKSYTATGDFAVEKLLQVALTATNLDLAIEFYRNVLGLKFIARLDPPGLAYFQLGGGARLLLSTTASHASLYFLVDDVDAAVRDLKKRGVSFFQPPALIQRDEAGNFGKKGNEEWMAFFKDPSGNLLGLVERR